MISVTISTTSGGEHIRATKIISTNQFTEFVQERKNKKIENSAKVIYNIEEVVFFLTDISLQ